MKLFRVMTLGLATAALTACSTADVVSRNAPLSAPPLASEAAPQVARDYRLHSIRFKVPDDLRVSEANTYYPIADIVWRGDPLGNRSAQLSDIFQTSIQAAGQGMTGSIPVTVDVQLVRWHSVTERARYTVGGVHDINFMLAIRHAETGELLEEARLVRTELPALGGSAALVADSQGQTQKIRVTTHLTSLFFQQLTGMTGAET